MKSKLIILSISLSLLLTGCNSSSANKKTNPGSSISSTKINTESLRQFDKKSWEDFLYLYNSHNKIIETIENENELDLYNKLDKLNLFFSEKTDTYNYGTNEIENDYLDDFSILALSGKEACVNLMEYINNKEIKALSEAKDSLEKSKEKITLIVLNREKLLSKAGYNNEEIKQITESDLSKISYKQNYIDDFNLNELFEEKKEQVNKQVTKNIEHTYYIEDDYSSLVGTYKTVKPSSANVRTGPGFAYPISFHLVRGDSVYIRSVEYADERLWCYIGNGWISINTLNGIIK